MAKLAATILKAALMIYITLEDFQIWPMMLNPDVTVSGMLLHVSFVIDCILLIVLFKSILLGHLSNSGDLLLWVGVRRALTSSSQELLDQS